MDKLTIAATDDLPEVMFDPAVGVLMIHGNSTHTDVSAFYCQLTDWLDELKINRRKSYISVFIKFEYMNRQTDECMMKIFEKLVELDVLNCRVYVSWVYKKEDVGMLKAGNNYASSFPLHFTLIPISSDY